ncbi:hypothetical protein [Pedobacter endophyticus]|uniref:Uncharacterized protein n=1 Tax=Pedobacter endophyticus TaxID=2789740 RepID=A0A7S9PYM6_9SPHI|nr:hypothetical protein [Pedobacter endophyticus]QPH39503.1 hypothetical protein IZT61_21090 [Pedobacter endophyticus]
MSKQGVRHKVKGLRLKRPNPMFYTSREAYDKQKMLSTWDDLEKDY